MRRRRPMLEDRGGRVREFEGDEGEKEELG
jgi:hypothetical protein